MIKHLAYGDTAQTTTDKINELVDAYNATLLGHPQGNPQQHDVKECEHEWLLRNAQVIPRGRATYQCSKCGNLKIVSPDDLRSKVREIRENLIKKYAGSQVGNLVPMLEATDEIMKLMEGK